MLIRHFYHVYAAGAWAEPANEHVDALVTAEFSGQITIGLVGPAPDRRAVRNRLAPQLGALHRSPVDWLEAETGFEQVTLRALRAWAHASDGDAAVLYAHTKGSRDQSEWNRRWRRSMTRHVVGEWRRCVRVIADGYDTVGCHWLTAGDVTSPHEIGTPFYGGNFWWSSAPYLRRLPPIADGHRFDAEAWIGLAEPRAFDLRPGWPSEELFSLTNGSLDALH